MEDLESANVLNEGTEPEATPPDWREAHKDELSKEYIPVTEYQNLQRTLAQRDRALNEMRTNTVRPEHLNKVLEAMELLIDEDDSDTEPEPVSRRKKLQELREQLVNPTPQDPKDNNPNPEYQYLQRRLSEDGIDIKDKWVQDALSEKDPQTADEAIKVVLAARDNVSKSETEKFQSAVQAGVQEELKKMGLFKDGGVVTSTGDDEQFKRDYSEGRSNDHARMKKLLGM